MSAGTTPVFKGSIDKAFTRSPCNARNRQIGSPSYFQFVMAFAPLWGFGSFNSASNPLSGIVYNNDWPAVYNQQVEVWTGTDGSSGGGTTTFSPYFDIYQTTSGPGNSQFNAGATYTVTPTVISYTYGTLPGTVYTGTITLSGSILNPSGAGPFNPNDPTYGWAALTTIANTLLASVTTPAVTTTNGMTGVVPFSTGPSPGTFVSPNPDRFTDGNGGTGSGLCAAMNGFPYTGSASVGSDGFNCATGWPFLKSIADWAIPTDLTDFVPNQGACVCAKSSWNLSGSYWVDSVSGGQYEGEILSDHLNLFIQPITVSTGISSGTVTAATTFMNPLEIPVPPPLAISFAPSDVTANLPSGYTYGMLGFSSVPG